MKIILFLLTISQSLFNENQIQLYIEFRSTPIIRDMSDIALTSFQASYYDRPGILTKINHFGLPRHIYEFIYHSEKGTSKVTLYAKKHGIKVLKMERYR